MPTTNCLVFEPKGEWAAAVRRRVNQSLGGVRVVEIREWDGLREALQDAPASLIAVDASHVTPISWMARWPSIGERFPLARAVALSRYQDHAVESALRDAGVIEVIRGRLDLDCLLTLLSRQWTRYPEAPASWRSAIVQRLPWETMGVDEAG